MDFSGFKGVLNKIDSRQPSDAIDIESSNNNQDVNSNNRHIASGVNLLINELINTQINDESTLSDNKQLSQSRKKTRNQNQEIGSGHRKRARERFLLNPDEVSECDLLELLLFLVIPRADTKPIARSLLSKFGTIYNVFNADSDEIRNCGVNADALAYLATLMKTFSKRILKEKWNTTRSIDNYEDLKKYCMASVGSLVNEELHILFFDNQFNILKDKNIGLSNVSDVFVSSREICKIAMDIGASNVVIYHNHPSGDFTPSKNDIDTTLKIIDALKVISVDVHDHIIVAGAKCFSFAEHHLLNLKI